MLSGGEVVCDLAEDPRATLSRATDQHGVAAGLFEHLFCFFRRVDVAIGRDRDRDRLLDRTDGFVFSLALIQIFARAAMHGQRRDACVFRDLRDRHAVTVSAIPPGAYFQRHWHLHRVRYRGADAGHQRLVLQQCRARPNIADLLRRTAHVDIDDLGAMIDVVACRIGQHLRIVARDLHRDRRRFVTVVHAQPRLARVPQLRVGDRHLGHCQPGAQLFA